MGSIDSHEHYLAVISKYGDRLKLAQSKFSDFKRELSSLQQAIDLKPPASATKDELETYKELQSRARRWFKLADEFVGEYDDLFATAAKTLKLGR